MKMDKVLMTLLVALPTQLLAQSNSLYSIMEKGVVGTVLYSLIGIIVMVLAVKVVDIITPGNLFQQISKEENLPLAIFTSAMVIGIAIIIAAAIVS